MIQREAELVGFLRRNTTAMRQMLGGLGISSENEASKPRHAAAEGGIATLTHTAATAQDRVPIFTFTLDSSAKMEKVHQKLFQGGIYAPYIEYPGGPTDRFFRLTVSAKHTPDQIRQLGEAISQAL